MAIKSDPVHCGGDGAPGCNPEHPGDSISGDPLKILPSPIVSTLWGTAAGTTLRRSPHGILLQPPLSNIPPSPFPDDWLAGWNYRLPCTISNTATPDDLTSYPCFIRTPPATYLLDHAAADGRDFRWTLGDGLTLIPHHTLELVDSATKRQGYFFPLLPSLSATAATQLYLYYGNDDAAEGSDPDTVWASDYGLVTCNDYPTVDHSPHHNTISLLTSEYAPGPVWKSSRFSYAGRALAFTDHASLRPAAPYTISTWFTAVSGGHDTDWGRIWDRNNAANHYGLVFDTSANVYALAAPNPFTYTPPASILFGHKQHLALTHDNTGSGTLKIYINGTLVKTQTPYSQYVPTAHDLYIGNQAALNRSFDGTINHFVIHHTVRPIAWIQADHNIQGDQATYILFSPEETIL